jgi:hypothetical protein
VVRVFRALPSAPPAGGAAGGGGHCYLHHNITLPQFITTP